MSEKAKIEDVAQRARVSKATVSRVLNRPDIVSEQTLKRVRKAMDALDFTPNRHARALNGFQTKTVGLLFFENLRDLFVNQFWGEATSTVYESLIGHDLDCSLIALGESAGSMDRFRAAGSFTQFLQTRNVDGFILVGNVSPEQELLLGAFDTPVVMWGRPTRMDASLTYVDSDNLGGSRVAVQYLLGLERRRVATITGGDVLPASRDRYDGYASALRDASIPLDESMVAHGDFGIQSGREAMGQILDANETVDAVFAANDEMAIGAIEVLRSRGISVPQDVAVVGFDNTSISARDDISLTTISHSYTEIGAELVEALVLKMQGAEARSRLIETTLVTRDSA